MTVTARRLSTDEVDAAFKALASEQRRLILRLLATCTASSGSRCTVTDEVCACKISEALGLAPSTISHHMTVLRNAGLVSARKEGTWVHYTLQRSAIRQVAAELLDF